MKLNDDVRSLMVVPLWVFWVVSSLSIPLIYVISPLSLLWRITTLVLGFTCVIFSRYIMKNIRTNSFQLDKFSAVISIIMALIGGTILAFFTYSLLSNIFNLPYPTFFGGSGSQSGTIEEQFSDLYPLAYMSQVVFCVLGVLCGIGFYKQLKLDTLRSKNKNGL